MASNNHPNIVALLTGRGGSTLKDKNTIPILGRPLLQYPAEAARRSALISDFFVSSDSDTILQAAEAVGYVPIRRPEELSKPDSQHADVIKHALGVLADKGVGCDIVVVILANSVTVKTEWIDDCITMMLEGESLTAVAPVYADSDHHPFRAKRITAEGLCEPFFDFAGKRISTNRQDLDPSYFFCHTFWVLRTSNFETSDGQQPWAFMGSRIKPYVMRERTFDVHEPEDIDASEAWVREQGL